jgi:hypothetical protein
MAQELSPSPGDNSCASGRKMPLENQKNQLMKYAG